MGLPKPTVQLLLKENQDHACAEAPEICVKVMAIADLPDMFGEFQVVAFWNNFDRKEHAALMHGIRITGRIPVVVPPNKYDRFYLETKKRAGHLLDKTQPEEFLEQAEELQDNHHWEQAE